MAGSLPEDEIKPNIDMYNMLFFPMMGGLVILFFSCKPHPHPLSINDSYQQAYNEFQRAKSNYDDSMQEHEHDCRISGCTIRYDSLFYEERDTCTGYVHWENPTIKLPISTAEAQAYGPALDLQKIMDYAVSKGIKNFCLCFGKEFISYRYVKKGERFNIIELGSQKKSEWYDSGSIPQEGWTLITSQAGAWYNGDFYSLSSQGPDAAVYAYGVQYPIKPDRHQKTKEIRH